MFISSSEPTIVFIPTVNPLTDPTRPHTVLCQSQWLKQHRERQAQHNRASVFSLQKAACQPQCVHEPCEYHQPVVWDTRGVELQRQGSILQSAVHYRSYAVLYICIRAQPAVHYRSYTVLYICIRAQPAIHYRSYTVLYICIRAQSAVHYRSYAVLYICIRTQPADTL